jgi:peptidoglycan biosynthesis protein MviN/MurJ (putative lipid II flippase)
LLPALLRGLWTLDWIARGREAAANRMLAGMLLAQLGLGLALIPALGAMGAALAAPLAEALGLILLWRPVRAPVAESAPGLEGESR